MCINESVDSVISRIGHNGDEILWPYLQEPNRRKGFSFSEICFAALQFNYAVIPFSIPDHYWGSEAVAPVPMKLEMEKLYFFDAIVVGKINTNSHAVAWSTEDKLILDPNGTCYPLDKFDVEIFCVVRKLA